VVQFLYQEELIRRQSRAHSRSRVGGASRWRFALAGVLLLMDCGGLARAAELPATVYAALQRAAIPESAASFWVEGLDGQRLKLAVNADRPMNPASTMKLVTTFSALELLGPAYTWKTRLYTTATAVDGVLDGDLYLRGGGDPQLVLEKIWLIIGELRARGVREIRGDLVIDRSLFESADYDPARFDQEPSRPYNVGPDALLLNFKAVTLHFVPDSVQRQVRVFAVPALAGVHLGEVRYADGPCGDFKARLAADYTNPEQIRFAGSYSALCGEKEVSVSLYSHGAYDSALLRALWSEAGGSLGGRVRDGTVPDSAALFYEYESAPLAEVVRDINKYSNNVMARELYLSLAAAGSSAPASPEGAARVVADFLNGRGLAMPELVTDNGSGLSRNARISAASMGRLLEAAWQSPVMPEFMSSLPVVGLDGTMRHRLDRERVAGQAHVKTGTLADSRAVAGYVLAASGHRYAVVSFINHPNAGAAQAVQDALLQWIYERG
jgi:D-alanyl-D-alanine carboxypeptidase/D-alanyl-D-alanine-endopeptidase (penicillin-binding protein 4)